MNTAGKSCVHDNGRSWLVYTQTQPLTIRFKTEYPECPFCADQGKEEKPGCQHDFGILTACTKCGMLPEDEYIPIDDKRRDRLFKGVMKRLEKPEAEAEAVEIANKILFCEKCGGAGFFLVGNGEEPDQEECGACYQGHLVYPERFEDLKKLIAEAIARERGEKEELQKQLNNSEKRITSLISSPMMPTEAVVARNKHLEMEIDAYRLTVTRSEHDRAEYIIDLKKELAALQAKIQELEKEEHGNGFSK